jgi:UDP-2-acetamido-2,6-beta-L-arabino-hexul-4-ose reductase
MRVLVTGANGFLGKNLVLRLREQDGIKVLTFVRNQNISDLNNLLIQADAVVHLAGENRPLDMRSFIDVNVGFTDLLCSSLLTVGKSLPIIYASSVQAELDNLYGKSKLSAEKLLQGLANQLSNPLALYRLPGVFGKWCKPHYNSVVATFCFNKARNLPVQINNLNTPLRLVYVDDVIDSMLDMLSAGWVGEVWPKVMPEYGISLGDLSKQIDAFKNSRTSLVSERVGAGFARALYATYLSYLPVEKFSYSIPVNHDSRGMFVEMLKTHDSGQFSFFTAYPGITRGGHYHHTKTEKFLVINGNARFSFRHILTNEMYHLETNGDQPQIVETVPGWVHNITNIGKDKMVVMLWASEVFDCSTPDTFANKV